MTESPKRPEAAGEKAAGDGRAEPLAGDVSRASAASPAEATPAPKPAAPKPAAAAGKPAEAKVMAPPAGPVDPPPPADLPLPVFIEGLKAALPDAVSQVSFFVGDWVLIVPVARLLDVMRHLRDASDARFDFCSDLTATDWPPRAERFDVIYCLYSIPLRHRVRVKVRVGLDAPVPSVTGLWPAANWFEREVFDLFGIPFEGHPDLRRILMPDDWQGHPQRKDYPLEGPGELLLESPIDWLKVRQASEIE